MKIIGSLIIMLASIICSYLYEKRLKLQVECLERFISFIKYVKSKIEYFSQPTNKIFSSYSDFEYINSSINDRFSLLGKNEKALLDDFFQKLGSGYKAEELSLCDYTSNAILETLTEFKSKNPSKIKIFRALSLFFGASVIIFIV
jgi:hypothetical protein